MEQILLRHPVHGKISFSKRAHESILTSLPLPSIETEGNIVFSHHTMSQSLMGHLVKKYD